VLASASNLKNTVCSHQSSFSKIKVSGSRVQEFTVLAAGFSLLAAGRKPLTTYQLPGTKDQQPDA